MARDRGIWQDVIVPRRSSKDHDFFVNARRVVEQAIGEQMDGSPLEDPDAGKNPAAVARGKKGGKVGGRARAESLSPCGSSKLNAARFFR
jgi:hypothetical protein